MTNDNVLCVHIDGIYCVVANSITRLLKLVDEVLIEENYYNLPAKRLDRYTSFSKRIITEKIKIMTIL